MTLASFTRAERKRRDASRSGRRVTVSSRQTRDLRDLADQAGAEMPLIAFSSDAKEAARRLQKHLAAMRQPTLPGFGGLPQATNGERNTALSKPCDSSSKSSACARSSTGYSERAEGNFASASSSSASASCSGSSSTSSRPDDLTLLTDQGMED